MSLMQSPYSFDTDAIDSESYFQYSCKDGISIDDENMEDEKVEKGRERNREHAKRTRLRKKAVLEGMKGKLMELQNEASKLQQCFEERNTANILLCLCSTATPEAPEEESAPPMEPGFDPTIKGDIIQQLRTKVRCEAARKNQQTALIRPRTNSISGSDAPPSSSSFTAYADAGHLDTDCDSDNEDDDAFQPLPKSVVNWKNGTVVSEEGAERKLSDGEMGHLRKERNRVHAKMTRDRKKLFTSRMQQMISSLEKQNRVMKTRLKSLAHSGDASPTQDRDREIDRQNTPPSLGHSTTPSHPPIPPVPHFSSDLTMSILEAMYHSSYDDLRDSRGGDLKARPLNLLASQQNSNQPDPKRFKTSSSPRASGIIGWSCANDPNPFLGHLGPLSRVRDESPQFSTSQFSSPSSFLEAL